MYGTPWPGDAGYAINESAPLKGLFFLAKGTENSIRKLPPSKAVLQLMPVVSIPFYEREKVENMMTFFEDLTEMIPAYELTFMPDEAIVHELLRFVGSQ